VQLVPKHWVDESTRVHVKDATPYRSYGYMWWIYPQSGVREASGNGGQRIFVSPRENLVIVHLAERKAFVDEGVKAADYAALVGKIRQARNTSTRQ
jgi:CubicO group peptidase (beta-lactamase class C family)